MLIRYKRYFVVALFILSWLFIVLPCVVHAQNASLGVANSMVIKDTSVVDGDIVSSSSTGYFLSHVPYDTSLFGVVSDKPAILFNTGSATPSANTIGNGQAPVVTSGMAYVLVSGENGSIQRGDWITSSSQTGVGMKATASGYVLGTALESLTADNAQSQGKIKVSLDIHYNAMDVQSAALRKLSDFFALSSIAYYESPSMVFRYMIAGSTVLLTFLLGFILFGRISLRGIEALGRNPMAEKTIKSVVKLNILMMITVVACGVIVAFLVLKI